MTKEAAGLPAEIGRLLDGNDLAARASLVFELMTVAPSGWPHVALLSVGEVVAIGEHSIGLALWPTSTTTDNLRRTGRALLQIYHDGAAYRMRLAARPLADEPGGGKLALFSATVESTVRDEVSYARLTSGPTIELPSAERAVARWQAQVDAVRRAAAVAGEPGSAN